MNNKQVKRIRRALRADSQPLSYRNIEYKFRGDVPRDKDGNPRVDENGVPLPPKMIVKKTRVMEHKSLKRRVKVTKRAINKMPWQTKTAFFEGLKMREEAIAAGNTDA